MAPKRSFRDEGSDDGARRRLGSSNAFREAMRGTSLSEIVTKMEPFLRKVVREEIECVVHTFQQSRPSNKRIESSQRGGLELRFESKIPSTIFTSSRLETEDNNTPIKVVLFDASSNSIVSTGPLSCAKVEIVVLHSDFASDDQENWSEEEFRDAILREREGKRPLVTGELNVTLKNGVGYVSEVCFTDNSSWTRSRRFKLGARVLQKVGGEVRVREAASEAFVVKDHRGELYKKHHPPHLRDEVWRLERIAKDGAFHKRLTRKGIERLIDFLQLYHIDSTKLREILGGGISNRTWDIIIEHAKACVVDDDKFYVFYGEGAGILLNSIFNVVGVTFDGQNYMSLDALNFSHNRLVQDLKRLAYKNVGEFVPIDKASIGGLGRPLATMQDEPFAGQDLSLQHLDLPIVQQEAAHVGFNDGEASTSHTQMDLPMTQNFHSTSTHMFSPMQRNSFRMVDFSSGTGSGWSPSAHLGTEDMICQAQTWSPNVISWGQGNEQGTNFLTPIPNLGVHISRRGRSKNWCKIRAVIKWRVSFKAAKKRPVSHETVQSNQWFGSVC